MLFNDTNLPIICLYFKSVIKANLIVKLYLVSNGCPHFIPQIVNIIGIRCEKKVNYVDPNNLTCIVQPFH